MSKLNELLETNPIVKLATYTVTIFVFGFGIGWAASEYIRVDDIQEDLEKQEKKVAEQKAELKKYDSFDVKKAEFSSLVVYDSDDWLAEGESVAILGGQVSIELDSAISRDAIYFEVDAAEEPELQDVEVSDGERGKFKYGGKTYLINIKDYSESTFDDEVKISVSELKK